MKCIIARGLDQKAATGYAADMTIRSFVLLTENFMSSVTHKTLEALY